MENIITVPNTSREYWGQDNFSKDPRAVKYKSEAVHFFKIVGKLEDYSKRT